MTDDDIDFSDDPERDAHFLAQAVIWPGPKKQITLRIDADVLGYFREQGRGFTSPGRSSMHMVDCFRLRVNPVLVPLFTLPYLLRPLSVTNYLCCRASLIWKAKRYG